MTTISRIKKYKPLVKMIIILVIFLFVISLGVGVLLLSGSDESDDSKKSYSAPAAAPVVAPVVAPAAAPAGSAPSVDPGAAAAAAAAAGSAPAPAPAAPVDVSGYTRFDNFKLRENEDNCTDETDVNACKTRCDYNNNCTSFSLSEDDKCCLNTETTGIAYDDKHTTYVRTPTGYSIEQLGDKTGGILSSAGATSFTACIDKCSDTEECVGISYKEGSCELKKSSGMSSSYSENSKQFIKNNNPRAKSYQFHNSVLPSSGATIIDVSEIPMGKVYNVPEVQGNDALWYMQLQNDGNLVWVKRGTGARWSLGSHVTMPGTRVYLQGDGNLCAYGNGRSGGHCTMSHSTEVPNNQHKLVLKSNGEMYVDHGNGQAARSYIHRE